MPQGPGVRDDSSVDEGGDVPIFYDPLISKLVTWGDTRSHALARMRRALAEYEVRGIKTTIPFFQWVLQDDDFAAGRFDTDFIDRKLGGSNGDPFRVPDAEHEEFAAIAVALAQIARRPGTGADAAEPSRWRATARMEGLR